MKTKDLIKQEARKQFNSHGVRNVTLRDVAAAIGKSYGNITYHYPNKETLVTALYQDYHGHLRYLATDPSAYDNLLAYFLALPAIYYDLTLDYLFLHVDYIELSRSYPELLATADQSNRIRMEQWRSLMQLLQSQGYLQADLTTDDLDYIMELSTGLRMLYFQQSLSKELEKETFIKKVNKLLLPYLTPEGAKIYHEMT